MSFSWLVFQLLCWVSISLDAPVQNLGLSYQSWKSNLASDNPRIRRRVRTQNTDETEEIVKTFIRFCNWNPSDDLFFLTIQGERTDFVKYGQCVTKKDIQTGYNVPVTLNNRVKVGSSSSYVDNVLASDRLMAVHETGTMNVVVAVFDTRKPRLMAPIGYGDIPEGKSRIFFINALVKTDASNFKAEYMFGLTSEGDLARDDFDAKTFFTVAGPMTYGRGGYSDVVMGKSSLTVKIQQFEDPEADSTKYFDSLKSTINRDDENVADRMIVVGLTGSLLNPSSFPPRISLDFQDSAMSCRPTAWLILLLISVCSWNFL